MRAPLMPTPITDAAKTHGFKCPAFITRRAWAEAVAWNGDQSQSEAARLRDVLVLARRFGMPNLIERAKGTYSAVFLVDVVPDKPGAETPRTIKLALWALPDERDQAVVIIASHDET